MWDTIKRYGRIAKEVLLVGDNHYEFAQERVAKGHNLQNHYNQELIRYADDIRLETNDSKNWSKDTRPLDAKESISAAEATLQKDIRRHMESDESSERRYGYQMLMEHYDDLLQGARSKEEKRAIEDAMRLESQRMNQMEKMKNSPGADKAKQPQDQLTPTNDNDAIRRQIEDYQRRIEELQRQLQPK